MTLVYVIPTTSQTTFPIQDNPSLVTNLMQESTTKDPTKMSTSNGFGFKSVFSCSDRPTILSQGWKFRFQFRGDEVDFITPEWISDTSELPKDILHEWENEDKTVIYLPFKGGMVDDSFTKELLDTVQTLAYNAITLRKIKRLTVKVKRGGEDEPEVTVVEVRDKSRVVTIFKKILRLTEVEDKT